MTWLQASACFLAVLVLITPSLATLCPNGCECSNTKESLHKATCSSLAELYKFTVRQKHYNINILNLSHNNITKLSHELDRLTEVVTLDLSTNGITDISKFLHNAKKLVHLNLANNRIRTLSLTHLPASVSSLDLTNNLLQDVPSDLGHLKGLEHLELEGNPIDCSCKNIRARDRLLLATVFIDKVACHTPFNLKGRSWLELKTKDICKIPKTETNLDIMMGDQPIDAVSIGEETMSLKSMSQVKDATLEEGIVIHGANVVEDDDNVEFMKVSQSTSSSPLSDIEGSGEFESTTISELIIPRHEPKLNTGFFANDKENEESVLSTDDPMEGSGEGSGFEPIVETTTPYVEEFNPEPVERRFPDEDNSTTEFPIVIPPTLFKGGSLWNSQFEAPSTEKPATPLIIQDTTVSEKISSSLDLESKAANEAQQAPHKTGTYICIAIIVVLLVGLIGFAIIKGQMRKRRDRRLLRQQKRDVEKASKEMIDMNKSLLGKPAIVETPVEKKVNGKYELVPTHESHQKKSENGDITNGLKQPETNGIRTDSPRDTNQNKSSSKDNNIANDHPNNLQDTSFASADSPDSRKDTHSLSSEDIFVPLNDDDGPRINGNLDSDISRPLMLNGDHNTDSDFLSPSREYVPVYSPDMGRVRIKMTETPKPKTPVLVTRSKSNAGDIIITPSGGVNVRKSTT